MDLLIGTSGWSYDEWVGPFYAGKEGMFRRYAQVFNTVEVNSTFYSYPRAGMVRAWYREAPPGFIFAAKLPRLITHDKGLRLEEGVEADTERFLDLMRPLAEKLGPILIQLPPRFSFGDAEALERYLDSLSDGFEWAVEFRHPSWMRTETWEILRGRGVAYVIVDEPLLPPEVHVTTDFAYIRWHGRGRRPWYDYDYSSEELEGWVPRVRETAERSRRVYGYFNNHFLANAVKNAVEMLALLGSTTAVKEEALLRIVEHGELIEPRGVRTLESFSDEEGLSVADLLMRFTSASRLLRAEEIGEGELTVEESTGDRIEASIRGYSMEVDLENRVLSHDCDDWRKGAAAKRMCKHVARLFLSLPEARAKEVLTSIWNEKERWRFE